MLGAARRIAALTLAGVTLSACSGTDFNRWLYALGDQYACTQGNEERPNESARDVACTDPSHPSRTSYDDYARAREAADTDQ